MPHRHKIWIATVYYRSELGSLDVFYGVDDLSHLHAVIQAGPGYGVIEHILVERNPGFASAVMTVESMIGASQDAANQSIAAERLVSGVKGPQSGSPDELGAGL